MELTADRIVSLLEEDRSARRRLAELLISEPDVRMVVINAVLRDVATKADLESLRKELKADVESLRKELKADVESLRGEVGGLRERVARLESSVSLMTKVIFAVNVPVLVAVVGLLLKLLSQ